MYCLSEMCRVPETLAQHCTGHVESGVCNVVVTAHWLGGKKRAAMGRHKCAQKADVWPTVNLSVERTSHFQVYQTGGQDTLSIGN